ncbi:MAG: acyl-CoA dehydratase activase, partial [Proteobacteria bacterium]|nr:acyl-CoA dehydratase activase [Pseudomonadota bacterium]
MIFCGIDSGSRFIKTVLVDCSKRILAKKIFLSASELAVSFENIIKETCLVANIDYNPNIPFCITGYGRFSLPPDSEMLSDSTAIAEGVKNLYTSVRTIIDVGAESTLVVKLDSSGNIISTNINDKCSAGSGFFLETVAKVLDIPLAKISENYLSSEKKISVNTQCTIFAESEIISLIHSGVNKNDIVRAIIDSVAMRVAGLVKRINLEKDVMLIGGMSENPAFV